MVDADLSGYFDSIPHAELLKSVARRVSDRQGLHLVKMWLTAPVEETDARGGWERLGHAARLQAVIVNYADDFVICTRGRAEESLTAVRDVMARLKLTVNERKMRRCRLPAATFTFPGGGTVDHWRDGWNLKKTAARCRLPAGPFD